MGFNHSVKVPTQYRKAAVIFKKVVNENKSVKTLVFEEMHAKRGNLLSLLGKYSDNREFIEKVIEDTKILVENSRLDPFMCRVLTTELLFGAKNLKGESKPVQCVRSYQNKFLKYMEEKPDVPIKQKVNKPRYVRINTNCFTDDDAHRMLADEEWKFINKNYDTYDEYLQAIENLKQDEYIMDKHVGNLFTFPPDSKNYWATHNLVLEKKLLLQDKATCLASMLLDPEPNSVVLDMCAAPGMKTIHLSNLMNNQGKIYAVEQNESRYQLLCNMLKSANVMNVETVNADILKLKNNDIPKVEYILVDPSCSGSGMGNRISLIENTDKDKNRLWKLAGLQIKILLHAMTEFPDTKRIVYSTCSLNEEENEQVIQKCLERCDNFKLLNAKKSLSKQWNHVGNTNYKGIGKYCIYSLPDKDFTCGIFIAVFERKK